MGVLFLAGFVLHDTLYYFYATHHSDLLLIKIIRHNHCLDLWVTTTRPENFRRSVLGLAGPVDATFYC